MKTLNKISLTCSQGGYHLWTSPSNTNKTAVFLLNELNKAINDGTLNTFSIHKMCTKCNVPTVELEFNENKFYDDFSPRLKSILKV